MKISAIFIVLLIIGALLLGCAREKPLADDSTTAGDQASDVPPATETEEATAVGDDLIEEEEELDVGEII